MSEQQPVKRHINIIDDNLILKTTSIKAKDDKVFTQEILHNSKWPSFKLVFHKDVNSVQNIWKLYKIDVHLQHN